MLQSSDGLSVHSGLPRPHNIVVALLDSGVLTCSSFASSGRFGFVEMRTEELATSAMALDKVELCGRNINVGRPKGYVEPPQVPASAFQAMSKPQSL